MNNKELIKNIFNKKTQDFTVAIIFLLVFSFFIFFIIKPSLSIAFSLKKEAADLKKINDLYDKKIIQVSNIQDAYINYRDTLPLLNKAISVNPEVNKIIDDIKKAADNNNFFINKANISNVDLKQSKKDIDKVVLNIEGKTDFVNLLNFTKEIFNQRRLKTIDKIIINQDKESTEAGRLQVNLLISGYYL